MCPNFNGIYKYICIIYRVFQIYTDITPNPLDQQSQRWPEATPLIDGFDDEDLTCVGIVADIYVANIGW